MFSIANQLGRTAIDHTAFALALTPISSFVHAFLFFNNNLYSGKYKYINSSFHYLPDNVEGSIPQDIINYVETKRVNTVSQYNLVLYFNHSFNIGKELVVTIII